MTLVRPCERCGSNEPFHIHMKDAIIKDYSTIGRFTSAVDAARAWRSRALHAESELIELKFRLDSLDK